MVKPSSLESRTGALIRCVCFVLLLWLLLDMPDHPDAFSQEAFYRFPLEIPWVVALLLIVPVNLRQALIWIITFIAAAFLFLKLADIGTQAAFQRPFNSYLDGKMILDGWNVLVGSVGRLRGGLVLTLALLGFCGFIWLFAYTATFSTYRDQRFRVILLTVSAGLSLAGVALLQLQNESDWQAAWRLEASAFSSFAERSQLVLHSIRDMRAFEQDLAADDTNTRKAPLFEAIRGRDVFVIFVESLGRSAVQDPRYAPLVQRRLADEQQRLLQSGIHMASQWVRSPTVGGLSWLAHGTLLSGLWIDSQARYDRLVRSERQSLNRLFQQAGWQTFAAMPAITMDWPESGYFGYDKVYAAKDLGYKGKPFNWITMPDQYTLSAIDRLIRLPSPRKPAMIETALISSHAPWTPVPHMIDWEKVGDGTVFNFQSESDQTPAEVWKNPDNVREHYIRTIDYSLEAVSSYIAQYGRGALFIVIGDHQPAAIVTGAGASRDVPLFILSQDAPVIAKFEDLGFSSGLLPGDHAAIGMQQLRNLMVEALSSK